uniref:Putative secreted protein n=1 Tax=Anopheles darlingi TaxID=43151 RepID=A0A2M4DJK6_ANODA
MQCLFTVISQPLAALLLVVLDERPVKSVQLLKDSHSIKTNWSLSLSQQMPETLPPLLYRPVRRGTPHLSLCVCCLC